MDETEKYRLSLYQPVSVIKNTELCMIEVVCSTLDGQKYIKRTYPDDERELTESNFYTYLRLVGRELIGTNIE